MELLLDQTVVTRYGGGSLVPLQYQGVLGIHGCTSYGYTTYLQWYGQYQYSGSFGGSYSS